jgi:hypothetical protein
VDERDENKEIPASGSAAAKEGDHPEKRTANEHVEKSLKTLTPYHMAKHFYSRISNQYGWRLFSWGAPFNVTVAADRLRDRYAASYVPHEHPLAWNLSNFANLSPSPPETLALS